MSLKAHCSWIKRKPQIFKFEYFHLGRVLVVYVSGQYCAFIKMPRLNPAYQLFFSAGNWRCKIQRFDRTKIISTINYVSNKCKHSSCSSKFMYFMYMLEFVITITTTWWLGEQQNLVTNGFLWGLWPVFFFFMSYFVNRFYNRKLLRTIKSVAIGKKNPATPLSVGHLRQDFACECGDLTSG